VNANFLIPSLVEHGLDPKALQRAAGAEISIADGGANAKAWRDIWSAARASAPSSAPSPRLYIDRLAAEYAAARQLIGLP
jgi:nitronate monooxygenase